MNPATPPAGCLSCGACCHSRSPTFVRLRGEDWSRLGDRTGKLAHFINNRAYLRMEGNHCAALSPRTSAAGNREYFCTIYELRPQVCRDLKRGTLQCLGERELKSGLTGGAVNHDVSVNKVELCGASVRVNRMETDVRRYLEAHPAHHESFEI